VMLHFGVGPETCN